MRNRKQHIVNAGIMLVCFSFLTLIGCKVKVKEKENMLVEQHMAEVNNAGIGKLFIDEVPPARLMQIDDSTKANYKAYRIGMKNNFLSPDKKKLLEENKYFQYDLQKDWVLKSATDSFKTVFFQPGIKTDNQTNEGYIVFEMPKGMVADTLIYQDSFGGWGIQKFILNSH